MSTFKGKKNTLKEQFTFFRVALNGEGIDITGKQILLLYVRFSSGSGLAGEVSALP